MIFKLLDWLLCWHGLVCWTDSQADAMFSSAHRLCCCRNAPSDHKDMTICGLRHICAWIFCAETTLLWQSANDRRRKRNWKSFVWKTNYFESKFFSSLQQRVLIWGLFLPLCGRTDWLIRDKMESWTKEGKSFKMHWKKMCNRKLYYCVEKG